MTSAWHCVTTMVRLVAPALLALLAEPTLITCTCVKIVFTATFPAVETVAMTDM